MEVEHSAQYPVHSKYSRNPGFMKAAGTLPLLSTTVGCCLGSLHRDSGQKIFEILPAIL